MSDAAAPRIEPGIVGTDGRRRPSRATGPRDIPLCNNVVVISATNVRLLGHPVSENSVGWCLAAGVRGKRPHFDRIARGSYQIRARR